MCRQVGIILGRKRRRVPEHDILLDVFTEMLVRSERGGPHATGVAVLRDDGAHRIAKRPLPARRFVGQNAFFEALGAFDNHATAILGHTRWRTRGSEKNNRNNHPIQAGRVIGTHNGTILNADELFRRFRLKRGAEVDSELLFRMADMAIGDGGLDVGAFLRLVGPCRGQIAAVLAAVGAPGRVVVLKGNKPLVFRYSRRYRAVAYATDAAVLDEAIAACCPAPHDWRAMVVRPMTMLVFRHEDVFRPDAHRLQFDARARERTKVKGRDRPMNSPNLHITLFVYGTLKRGQWNHDRFCRNAVDIRPATIVGRLYQLPAGFPAVVIPKESVLAHGTGDPLGDARTQADYAEREVAMPEVEGDWDWDVVHGELITFPGPARDLPPLDHLEGSRPNGHGLYRRALVAVRADTDVAAAWVYHMANAANAMRLRDGRWPRLLQWIDAFG